MTRSQLLAIMAAVPQDQLEAALSRLMESGKVAASRALGVLSSVLAYRRTWIIKDPPV